MSFQRTNQLRAAILHSFRTVTDAAVADRLRAFTLRDWRKLGSWLQASGIGLYFLAELGARGIKHAIPEEVLRELSQNLADNRERNIALRSEFVRLNAAFRESGLDFLNVKGISLGAEYCPDPGLRQQFDLDFWISEDQVQLAEAAMPRLGYRVRQAGNTLECQAGDTRTPALANFYKPPTQRLAEIHLRSKAEFEKRPRDNGMLNGFVFPTLSREQTFLYHALHITKHLRAEFTRASWLLELRNAIRDAHSDAAFWQSVREQCTSRETGVVVGVAIATAAKIFRCEVPEELANWTIDALTPRVRAWIGEFAETVVTANFPGTKLYLLLEDAMQTPDREPYSLRAALLPLRVPGFIAAQRGQSASALTVARNAGFAGQRLKFHLVEGLRMVRVGWQRNGTRSDSPERVAKQGGSIA